jgi:hypothetical protein
VTAHGPWLLKFCPDCGQRNDNADKCTNDRTHPGRQPVLVREPVVLESRLWEAEADRDEAVQIAQTKHDALMEAADMLRRVGARLPMGNDPDRLAVRDLLATLPPDRARGVLEKDTGARL